MLITEHKATCNVLIIKKIILLSGGLGCLRAGFFISQLIKVIKGYIINKKL